MADDTVVNHRRIGTIIGIIALGNRTHLAWTALLSNAVIVAAAVNLAVSLGGP